MRTLVSWLQDFVDIPEAPQELAERLTRAGMAVDALEQHGDEYVLEIDVTSNRPDQMNHFGLARELGAIYRRPVRLPEVEPVEDARPASEAAAIEILDAESCPRYVGRVFTGVEVRPSPDWLRRRLELCGIRSINTIADLTNYVLLELGHPTHAFDLDTLNGRRIVVRRGEAGEMLRTLDGIERTLDGEVLAIADAYRPVALAGVMGGLETEISDRTANVLLEAAWFEPGLIRRTARRYSMHTEASHRFERGADIEAAGWAADRIATLIQKVSPGAAVLKGRLDAYPRRLERPRLELRRQRLRSVLGAEVADAEARDTLERLGFSPEPTAAGWRVEVPSHRRDVEREIDLVEEAARIFGFDRIPSTLPALSAAPLPALREVEESAVRETLRALGYDETIGYSFISSEEARQFSSEEPIPLRNPLSELVDVMRTTSAPTLLRAVEWNLNRGERDLRLMEIGRLYRRRGESQYEEPAVLTLTATGEARPRALTEQPKTFDFFDLKGDLEELLRRFELGETIFDERETPPYYVTGRAARVYSDLGVIAYLGEVDPRLLAERKIRQPVFLAEIFLERLYAAGLRRPQHRMIPRVPAVQRDFSLLAPEGIPFAEIRAAVGPAEHLVELRPLEVLRGARAPAGFYSLLLRAVWQRESDSFTDEEIRTHSAALLENLERKLNVRQRA